MPNTSPRTKALVMKIVREVDVTRFVVGAVARTLVDDARAVVGWARYYLVRP